MISICCVCLPHVRPGRKAALIFQFKLHSWQLILATRAQHQLLPMLKRPETIVTVMGEHAVDSAAADTRVASAAGSPGEGQSLPPTKEYRMNTDPHAGLKSAQSYINYAVARCRLPSAVVLWSRPWSGSQSCKWQSSPAAAVTISNSLCHPELTAIGQQHFWLLSMFGLPVCISRSWSRQVSAGTPGAVD